MTYKQMTKQIEGIGKQIKFLYEIRDIYFKDQKEECHIIGNIVDNLCARKNYLIFEKEYIADEISTIKEQTDGKIPKT